MSSSDSTGDSTGETKKTNQTYSESQSNRLWRKTADAPFVPLGIAGTLGALVYGYHNYKHRGNMSTSVYLMRLRVQAQGMIVGAITIGVAYSLLTKFLFKKPDEEAHQRDWRKSPRLNKDK